MRTVLPVALLAVFGIALRYAVYWHVEGPGSVLDYVEAMCVWDCAWYRTIAEDGYDLVPGVRFRPGGANWAFFPLSPMIAGIVSTITSLPTTVTGFILSNLYAAGAVLAARPLFENKRAYWVYAALILAGPFSFLFSSLHTEGLFVLLTTLCFVALKRRSYLAAGVAAALLSATRLTGILMIGAIGLAALVNARRDGTSWRELPRMLLGDRSLLAGLAVAPLGLIAFMAFLRFHTGDGLAFLHIQRAWGRTLGNPFETLGLLANLDVWLSPGGMINATWVVAAAIGLALSGMLTLRGRLPEAAFCAAVIFVSLAGGTTSMVRFVAGLAPLGMIAAELLTAIPIVRFVALAGTTAAGAVLTIGWLNASPFAM